MNHDPSSASDAPPPPSPPPPQLDTHPSNDDETPLEEEVPDENEQQRRKRVQRDQRNVFLDHLIRNIDIMIYCQLSILYYMDLSLPCFILRAIPTYVLFTPKPLPLPTLPPPPSALPALLITNLLCVLFHLLSSPPTAGEATRGYLHGGVVIDFVGQKGGVGRWRMVGVDSVVMGLQVLALGVVGVRRGLGVGGKDEEGDERTQTHDAEERGVRSSFSAASDDGIELQPLNPRLLNEEDLDQQPASDHPLDTFNSGQHVIADLNLLDTLRSQWWRYRGPSSSVDAGVVEGRRRAVVGVVEVAGRRLGFRVGVGGSGRVEDGEES